MRFRLIAAVGAIVAASLLPATAASAHAGPHLKLQFRGQAIVPTGTMFRATTVGGLSSIAYNAQRDVYYAISDDPSQFQPARYYTLGLDIRDGRLTDGDVHFKDVTTFLAPDGHPYAPQSLDPEGLGLTRDHRLIITSEGLPNSMIDPFIRRYSLDGRFLGSLPLPRAFLASADHTTGVRPNLGFEGAGIIGHDLFTATENALYQDGPAATLTNGSPSRLLRYDLRTDRLKRQWVYETDPVAEPPNPPDQFSVNGVDDLLPIDHRRLIAMERSFSVGAPGTGNKIKLYEVKLGRSPFARKSLLLNLDDLGIPLDNVEGIIWGPRLRDGRRSLVLVSDNNFAASQFTQFLLFAVR
jgi:3-phytase/alkaline phosphatase D